MGVGTPGFEFQLTANRLGAGVTFLESKEVQPAQQGVRERDAAGPRDCVVSAKSSNPGLGERAVGGPQRGLQASVLALGCLSGRINF